MATATHAALTASLKSLAIVTLLTVAALTAMTAVAPPASASECADWDVNCQAMEYVLDNSMEIGERNADAWDPYDYGRDLRPSFDEILDIDELLRSYLESGREFGYYPEAFNDPAYFEACSRLGAYTC